MVFLEIVNTNVAGATNKKLKLRKQVECEINSPNSVVKRLVYNNYESNRQCSLLIKVFS